MGNALNQSELENAVLALEADVAALKAQVKSNRHELGANSRSSLVFVGGLIVMLMLGSRFSSEEGYTYAIELEKLTTLVGLPAVAALLTAIIPEMRR